MTDEGRFNVLPKVAEKLGYNLNDNASLWRDAALNVVNEVQSPVGNCRYCWWISTCMASDMCSSLAKYPSSLQTEFRGGQGHITLLGETSSVSQLLVAQPMCLLFFCNVVQPTGCIRVYASHSCMIALCLLHVSVLT